MANSHTFAVTGPSRWPRVLALVAQGRSYRLIGREVGLSKNTVADIVKQSRVR